VNNKKKRRSFRYRLKKKKHTHTHTQKNKTKQNKTKKLDLSMFKKENIPSRRLTKIDFACFEPAKIAAEVL